MKPADNWNFKANVFASILDIVYLEPMNELSKERYLKTFGNKMKEVTGLTSPVLDIWPEVENLVTQGVMDGYGQTN